MSIQVWSEEKNFEYIFFLTSSPNSGNFKKEGSGRMNNLTIGVGVLDLLERSRNELKRLEEMQATQQTQQSCCHPSSLLPQNRRPTECAFERCLLLEQVQLAEYERGCLYTIKLVICELEALLEALLAHPGEPSAADGSKSMTSVVESARRYRNYLVRCREEMK